MPETPIITFFPVGNGDMTLVELGSGKRIVIDLNITKASKDPDDEAPDVAELLRGRLERDAQGRLFVDAFLSSHPDADHCRGVRDHFHLGSPELWDESTDKILIRELWSSPIVFRRASSSHNLCADASALAKEARRRVRAYRDLGRIPPEGDQILIMGRDIENKTDDLEEILVPVDQEFARINGLPDSTFSAHLLGPQPPSDDEDDEAALEKNESSVILQFSIASGPKLKSCLFLTGGDAGVEIWKRLWIQHASEPSALRYNLLQTPHHCSWRSLSFDSWSDLGEEAQVCSEARSALGQAEPGAYLVSSSKAIKEGDSDPPCTRAAREYREIADSVRGLFKCTGEYPTESAPTPMEFEVTPHGPRLRSKTLPPAALIGAGAVGRQPLPHGLD